MEKKSLVITALPLLRDMEKLMLCSTLVNLFPNISKLKLARRRLEKLKIVNRMLMK